METLYPWLLLLAGLLVGALIGALVMRTLERRARGSEHDVREVRRELDTYREEVAAHYAETAKRVNQLTHAYKDVYDHLENGAYRLVGEPELRRRLDDAAPRPVTLEGIGQRGLQRPREDADGVPEQDHDRPRVPGPRPAGATSDANASSERTRTAGDASRYETRDDRDAESRTERERSGATRDGEAREEEAHAEAAEGPTGAAAAEGTAYRRALGDEEDEEAVGVGAARREGSDAEDARTDGEETGDEAKRRA